MLEMLCGRLEHLAYRLEVGILDPALASVASRLVRLCPAVSLWATTALDCSLQQGHFPLRPLPIPRLSTHDLVLPEGI